MSEHSTEKDSPGENDAPRWKEHRRKMAAGFYDRRDDGGGVEKNAPLPLAKDGKPGCPATVWDGPYSMRCSLGASIGKCAYHGTFARPIPPGSTTEAAR